jgi:hypothetical protein
MPLPRLLWFAAMFVAACATPASADDPPVPPGLDPGGEAIALITGGVDYTIPEIAARLARDGEGEPIAFDLVDGDVRPYSPAGEGRGTRLARIVLATYPGSRLVLVRVAATDPVALARAAVFASRTPARVVALGFWGSQPEHWKPFAEAARAASNVAFVLPGGTSAARITGDVFPAAFKLRNAIVAADLTVKDLEVGSKVPVDAWLGNKANKDYLVPLDAAEPNADAASPAPLVGDSVDGAAFIAALAACFATPDLNGAGKKKELLERAPFKGQGRYFFDLTFACTRQDGANQKM